MKDLELLENYLEKARLILVFFYFVLLNFWQSVGNSIPAAGVIVPAGPVATFATSNAGLSVYKRTRKNTIYKLNVSRLKSIEISTINYIM